MNKRSVTKSTKLLALVFVMVLVLSIALPIVYQPAQAVRYVDFRIYTVGPTWNSAWYANEYFAPLLGEAIATWIMWTGGPYLTRISVQDIIPYHVRVSNQAELDIWIATHNVDDFSIFITSWCEIDPFGNFKLGHVNRHMRNTWTTDEARIFLYQGNEPIPDAWLMSKRMCEWQIQKLIGFSIGMPKCGVWWWWFNCNGKGGFSGPGPLYNTMITLWRESPAPGNILCGKPTGPWWNPPLGCRLHFRRLCETNGWRDTYMTPPS